MKKDSDYNLPNELENSAHEAKPTMQATTKKILLAGGIVLLIGIGVAWKCWDGKKIDLQKLSTDELNDLRNKLQEILLSPNSDQESKIER